MIAAKKNQKFPFHFLSAPPTPPAEEKKKGKENFWFLLPRPKGADEARITPHQDCFQKRFEFCTMNTAIFRKGFRNQKYGRHEVPSVLNSPQKVLNPKGFATQSVAPR
jgi:hypothetical protein